jgi:hypothetical protein
MEGFKPAASLVTEPFRNLKDLVSWPEQNLSTKKPLQIWTYELRCTMHHGGNDLHSKQLAILSNP